MIDISCRSVQGSDLSLVQIVHVVRYTGMGRFLVITMCRTGVAEELYGIVVGVSGP
jgi:hypothetical protein